jgi:3beta-hydroxy-delta5-steroid dehydrogenase/steroid delta-isomerase
VTARDPNTLDADLLGPRCLVTGGNGYLGRALVRRLVAGGCEVRVLDIAPHTAEPTAESLVGDVRIAGDVLEACSGVDVVYHTVALIDLLSRYRPERRRRVFDVNVLGTQNVLRACRAKGVARFVYTSTINVAMRTPVRDGDETLPTFGEGGGEGEGDLYGESKSAAEREVLAADGDGLRTAALRLGGLWGPGDGAMMITEFVEQLAAGRFVMLVGDGNAVLDNTHVANAIDAHLLAAAALAETPDRVGGKAFFITDGEPMNGLEWFRPLVEGLNAPWPSRRVPAGVMLVLGRLLEWIHYIGGPEPAIAYRGMLNISRDASFSIDRAREELGYHPTIQSGEGLPAMLPDAKRLYDLALRGDATR